MFVRKQGIYQLQMSLNQRVIWTQGLKPFWIKCKVMTKKSAVITDREAGKELKHRDKQNE